jgi:phosphate-selective porin OprO/OprP
MKKLLLTATALGLILAVPAKAEESVSSRITKLEEELELLKRQNEVQKEVADAKAAKEATVEYGTGKGITVTSPDKTASLKIRGYGQVDSRTFTDTSNPSNVDQFLLRTARLSLDGKIDEDFSGRFTYDFGNNTTSLVDAYVDYKPDPLFNVRVGKFKAPIGLERLQSETEILTLERNTVTNLVPNRDLGIQVSGEIIPQTLEYQLALTNGAADGVNSSTDVDGGKDVVARIFAHPFSDSEIVELQGFGAGIAGSYGQRDGTTTSPNLTSGYRSHGQQTIFSYNPAAGTVFADGTTWRINPQSYFYYGPIGVQAEYLLESQELTKGTTRAELENDAWSVGASYVLTGENNSFEGIKPLENFSLANNTWGAFEIIGRYGVLDVDNDTFPTFANPASSVSHATERTVGLNWHLNQSLKINTAYSDTEFEGGATTGDRENERVYLTRLQFKL